MITWELIGEWMISGLVQNLFWVVLGIAFVQLFQNRMDQNRYGRWRVIIKKKGEIKVDRQISIGKAKEILSEPVDLAVFLKGVASPYGWINCDILEEGKRIGLYTEDRQQRRMIVDLDRNPPGEKSHEGAPAA
jgi:hypothetical protein